MAFDYLLYYSVVICWGINIFFLARFFLAWHNREPEKAKAWLAIAGISALALGVAFFLPARCGANFTYIGRSFFTKAPSVLLNDKEFAPVFTDWLSDVLSGYSLSALVWKNRLLPALSLFVFFTGLRRLGASIAVSAASAAFLFLNFLSPLNASSFATTSSNMFICLVSLLAVFDAYASAIPGPAAMFWIMSSLVLVLTSRQEFFPANLLLLAAFAAARTMKGERFLLKARNLAVIAAGSGILLAWSIRLRGSGPDWHSFGSNGFLHNLVYHLGTMDLSVIAGIAPAWPGPGADYVPNAGSAAVLCLLFILAPLAGTLAGCRADRDGAKTRLVAAAALLLWAGYFSVLFCLMDTYPLHFMRHHLYFLVPFAYLFALGADGFERATACAPAPWRRFLGVFCVTALVAYAALNAKAALGFNRELRTNDRELGLLMEAQRDWPAGCLAVFPVRNRRNSRAEIIRKYFPVRPDCGGNKERCLLKYVSPEPLLFSYPEPSDPLEQAPLAAGKPGDAWKAVSFPHAFYSGFKGKGQIVETRDPVPLITGFFRMRGTGQDQAYLETLAGACAFSSGDLPEAVRRFRRAAEEDPSCRYCRYLLSLSYAADGKRQEARAELAKIEKLARAKLSPEQRGLAESLARGETEKAAGFVRKLLQKNPDFFFLACLQNSRIQARSQSLRSAGL